MKKKSNSTTSLKESSVLVSVIGKQDDQEIAEEYLDELAFLIETADIIPGKKFIQRLDRPDKSTYLGSGKLAEVKKYTEDNEIGIIFFDDELSPSQQRNLEKATQKKIIDRTFLILEIFASRARTAHAKTQVELAKYQYLLPRLKGMWTHLERQRGGTGTRGGSGEKEIETDSRIVRDKISLLKQKLLLIDKQMLNQRKSREELVRVALVGYTNVGKSTIMNMLSKSNVFAENKLFATLDTTVRKVVIENLAFLLSDTVGFIRKLPHQLVESFKSTLDEVREADVLIHVVDISHQNFEEQIDVVNQTLTEIGASDKPTILVFNKIDAYKHIHKDDDDLTPTTTRNFTLDQMKKSWMSKLNYPCVFISATEKNNIDNLRQVLYDKVKTIHMKRYPYNKLLY